jgi:hypothetical protein
VYAQIASTVATERGRRPSPRSAAARHAATIAMFQPLIATTWLRPAVAKSSATPRSTRSRNPTTIPVASPAWGSGRTPAIASPAARRMLSIAERPVAPSRMSRTSTVPAIPDRWRYSANGPAAGGGLGCAENSMRSPGTTAG